MAVVIDVLALPGCARTGRTQNRQVVGLGPAAEKDQFLGVAAEQGGRFAARGFQALAGANWPSWWMLEALPDTSSSAATSTSSTD